MQRRLAHLPLHTGKAPPWLFHRMKELAGSITMAVVDAFGPEEMLRRLADPWWFQAFGCVLGFDWHSSGLTTVTCGAMKEAQRKLGDEMGLLVAGGKGGVSRNTPHEITTQADRLAITDGDKLIHASRMSAKVDSAAVQDGYQIYTHHFFYTASGKWCVVQQGMNDDNGWARRYHWLGETVEDFVCEPHHGVQDATTANTPEHKPHHHATHPVKQVGCSTWWRMKRTKVGRPRLNSSAKTRTNLLTNWPTSPPAPPSSHRHIIICV